MVIRIRLPALPRAWMRTRAPVAHAPIIGFDAAARAWITESGKATACAPLPSLRGRLLADIAQGEGPRREFKRQLENLAL